MSAPVRRTATRLADGRELIYFDDSEPYVSGSATRRLDDPGRCPTASPRRLDDDGGRPARDPRCGSTSLTGEWVAIASHRDEPHVPARRRPVPAVPRPRRAPSTADGEIPATDYDVVVFENRFPALLDVPARRTRRAPGRRRVAVPAAGPRPGRCEVVCFSADHNGSFADLTPARVRTVIEAWADRTAELSALPGRRAGVLLREPGRGDRRHAHPPARADLRSPFVTPRTEALLRQAAAHHERDRRQPAARRARRPSDAPAPASSLASEHWTAFVPAAARWPVEVHLAPNRDVLDLPGLTDAERDDLALVYPELLRRLDLFFTDDDGSPIPLPYIAGWHQAPSARRRDLGRLQLQVFSVLRAPGKLKYLAGSSRGWGPGSATPRPSGSPPACAGGRRVTPGWTPGRGPRARGG